MKPYIIVNPIAGSIGDLHTRLKQFRRIDARELYVTRRAGEAEARARQAIRAGCDYIIVAGGDGTLNEVINAIAMPSWRHGVRVGLLPLGTANDFARSIGLIADVEVAIDVLSSKKTARIDLVRMTGQRTRYFVNASCGGFSGVVNEKLTPEIKSSWGPLAYLRSAAAALPELHAYRTTVIFDESEKLMLDLYNVIVANGRFVAGGLPIAPEADPRDGLLDIVLVPRRSAPEMALLIAEMFLGKHLSSDSVIFRRAKEISVQSRPGMWFNADGELVGNKATVFQVLPRALDFVISKQ